MEISFCSAKPIQYQKISSIKNSVGRMINGSYKTRYNKTNSDYLAQMNRETRDSNIFQRIFKTIKALYRANRNV